MDHRHSYLTWNTAHKIQIPACSVHSWAEQPKSCLTQYSLDNLGNTEDRSFAAYTAQVTLVEPPSARLADGCHFREYELALHLEGGKNKLKIKWMKHVSFIPLTKTLPLYLQPFNAFIPETSNITIHKVNSRSSPGSNVDDQVPRPTSKVNIAFSF